MLLSPFMAVAQTNGSVPVGASITATDDSPSWLSASGEFAFGFHQMENKDYFLLSIWYEKIPEKTVVWYAMGEDPTDDPAVSRGIEGTVSSGVMNDTGNFVLQDRKSDKLWESFTHPTDTLLPTQIMEAAGIVSSRRTETNFSLGRFQLRFLDDGNLVLNSMNLPTKVAYDAYYTSGTYDASNSSNSGYQLIFNESGYMYILRRNGLREDLTKTALPTTDFYHRATLNFDGVFTQYSYPKTSSSNRSWSPVWSEPENICKFNSIWGSGACGYNSICSLSVDRRPNCNCPQEFSFLDQNDKHGSCIPNSEISCKDNGQNSSEELYDFVELRYVDYPSGDAEHLQPQNEEQCRKACLNDCLCGAVIFLGKDCWKKKLPLSNGKLDSGFNGKTFIKFKKGYLPPGNPGLQIPETKTGRDIKFITGIVLLVSSVFVNFILISTFCFRSSFIHRNKVANVRGKNNVQSNLRSFTYKELTEATEGFKDELGRGAFGGVYKGTIKTGFTDFIAVKKLDGVVEHDMEISGTGAILTDWAYDCYRYGTLEALIQNDTEAMNDVSTLERVLKVAIWCIQEVPSLRPTMRKVTQMLEGVVEVPAPPNPFPFNENSYS
ncbi:hypothetical protein OIU78_013091 [Salix suchowensis]|nr:hypothetical protein OIU78_013091 [Salix suchowensis]